MISEDRIDQTLTGLGRDLPLPPPLSAEFEAEITQLRPAAPRQPRRQFSVVALLSLLYGGFLVVMTDLRPDIDELPMLGVLTYSAVWLMSFLIITWLVLIPGRGRVMPNWRYAGVSAAIAVATFVAAGFLLPFGGPDSVTLAPLDSLINGHKCLIWGTITSLVPIALGSLLLRGSVPVGSRWAGAGLGAAGGSLGGLMLHLHCPVADPLHLGVIHGGVVLVASVIGAVLLPTTARH
ncbi:MAG: hypothetical protein Tsb0020_55080 [Haliangiales bacterium]